MDEYHFESVYNGDKNWKIYKLDTDFSLMDFNRNKRTAAYVKNNVELRLKLGTLQYEELVESLKPVMRKERFWDHRFHRHEIEKEFIPLAEVEFVKMKKIHVVVKQNGQEKEKDFVYFKVWDSTFRQEVQNPFETMVGTINLMSHEEDFWLGQQFDVESVYKIRRWILKYENFSLVENKMF